MITNSELRAWIKLPPDEEEKLDQLRTSVIALWETRTDLLWNKRTGYVEEIYTLQPGVTSIFLRLRPVSAISLLESYGSSGFSELASTTYSSDIAAGTLTRINGTWGRTQITYDGGYDATSCPADIKRALILQARFELARFSDEALVMKGKAFEKGSVQYLDATMHPYFEALAKRYRRVV